MTTIVEAPWEKYPGKDPWWGGWRQGFSEAWLHETWLPFWRALSDGERSRFLELNPPPTDDWLEYLTKHWL